MGTITAAVLSAPPNWADLGGVGRKMRSAKHWVGRFPQSFDEAHPKIGVQIGPKREALWRRGEGGNLDNAKI